MESHQDVEALHELLVQVMERHVGLQDVLEVAALLESMGWNDARAAESFHVQDVFELADQLWSLFLAERPDVQVKPIVSRRLWDVLVELGRSFLRGAIFALPMAISVFSMLTLKFSLWSYEYLSVPLATAIAIGTVLSFLSVGGFTQAIARRGFFYISQGYYNMSRRITFYFIAMGALLCALITGLVLLVNFIFNLFPYWMFIIIVLYFVFLNAIWLSVTVMYILRKELMFSGLITLGIAVVFVCFRLLHLSIIVSQLVALTVVAVLGIFLVIYYFRQAEKTADKGIMPRLPRWSVTIYSVSPYFTYGILYFAFLFTDRVMAWSANSSYMPYPVWFRGFYELGLDFSLIAVIIPMGVAEVLLFKFMMDVDKAQRVYAGHEAGRMNRQFISAYAKGLAAMGVLAVFSAAATYFSLRYFFHHFKTDLGDILFANSVTYHVFMWSLAGYTILCVGLMNAVTLFSLSRPDLVLRAMLPAFGVDLIVGFLLTRWVDYSQAVIGLFVGCVIFAVLSTLSAFYVMRTLDYHLYAAA